MAVPETFCFIVSFQLIIGTYRIRINATGDFQSGLVIFDSPAVINLNYFRLSVVGVDFGNREKDYRFRLQEHPPLCW